MTTLKKISIKNFKVFGEDQYTINFEDANLVLLDGPNGYGKTSVFDAIELALTGNISRLISLEGRQHPTDVVVAHKGFGDVEINIEFKDQNSNIRKFQRKLKSDIQDDKKKISKFTEIWHLNEVIEGDSEPVDQNTLDEYFGSCNFSRDFLLFHYVQQEETSRFLKGNSETQRAEELSKLFGDTLEAEKNLSKLTNILQKFTSFQRSTKARIDTINRLYKLDTTSLSTETPEPHFYLFPWLATTYSSPFWDEISPSDLNKNTLNDALIEINNVKNFLSHQNFFIRNRIFEISLQQREILGLYIGYYYSIKNHDLHVKNDSNRKLIHQFLTTLQSGNLSSILATKRFDEVFQVLSLGSSASFESDLQSLIAEENKSRGLSSIYTELLKHHDALSTGLLKVPEETECFLCGQVYDTHTSLNHAIAQHGSLIRSQLSEHDRLFVEIRDSFNETHLSPLHQACTAYLENTHESTDEDLLALTKAKATSERFVKLHKWLISEGIEHDDLIAKTFPVPGGDTYIAEATNHLTQRIRNAIGIAPEGYFEANGDDIFDRIYRDYFNSNQENLSIINSELLNKKERHIKNFYFKSLEATSKELSNLTEQFDRLQNAISDIEKLTRIIRTKIRNYRKKLITNIEIPFYIYSGKILQTHQAGCGQGIFIKDPTGNDELKNVRLVSNWKSDHDILNTMSSGQISAIVISLTLALHRVYSSKFSSILIDDPIQSMDDINMSSLVEVLRNDFKDKQIILSTHEEKVARYFTYKYLKYSRKVKIINVMRRHEYVPINKYLYRSASGS